MDEDNLETSSGRSRSRSAFVDTSYVSRCGLHGIGVNKTVVGSPHWWMRCAAVSITCDRDLACAPTIIPKKCPVCRREFVATAAVPDPLVDPSRWFHIVDCDQNGMIDKSELVDALKGMFPVEPGALEEVIEAKWATWDRDGNGTIDADEFRNHLAPFLANTLGNLRRRINERLPNLMDEPGEWFEHWDEDCSGTLERPEVVRALIKSIPDLTGRDEDWLTGTFSAIWALIDPNNDGSITQAEFIMPEGLYETLLANYYSNQFNQGY